MLTKTRLRLGAVASIAIGAMAFGAIPANADPAPGTFPPLVIVGSDTTQDVMAGLSTLNPTVLGSYDAFGGGNIVTRSGGLSFKRPNGSGDGVFALSMSAAANTPVFGNLYNGVNILGQVDIARSSSRPSSSANPTPGTGVLTYIPFAIDAMSYAYNAASTFPSDVPLGTTTTDLPIAGTSPARFAFTLRNIYNCRVTTYVDRGGNDRTIEPLIPQTGSGTRDYWRTTMGMPSTIPSCVSDLSNTVQEHDGRFLTGLHQIVGYSIAQYIAQGRHTQITQTVVQERKGNAVLGRVGTVNPFTLSGGTLTLNSAFPIQRQIFNVVETSRLGETAIAAALVGPTSTFCSAAGTAIINSYGFAADPTNCGSITLTSSYRTTAP
mgnify:CR=1 FL=1